MCLLVLKLDTVNPKQVVHQPFCRLSAPGDGTRSHCSRWPRMCDSALTSLRIRGNAKALNLSTNHDIMAPDALSIGSDFVEFQFSTQHPNHPVPIFHLHMFPHKIPHPQRKLSLLYSEMTEKLSPEAAITCEAFISSLLSNRFL